jgi:hypothetical protein
MPYAGRGGGSAYGIFTKNNVRIIYIKHSNGAVGRAQINPYSSCYNHENPP